MQLSLLTELTWQVYQSGRPNATRQTFDKDDIRNMLKEAIGNIFRQLYYETKKLNDGESEYYFYSPLLTIKEFLVQDRSDFGYMRVDFENNDMYRFPGNIHIVNVYPLGCEGGVGKSLSQVMPGEEYFYAGKAKFATYEFYVPKGMGANIYNIKSCVKKLAVEATWDSDDAEISLDIAYDAGQYVLGLMIRMPEFVNRDMDNPYQLLQRNLKQKIQQTQEPQL